MIGSGEADVAAIDCITFAQAAQHYPDVVKGTRILTETQAIPGLPLITSEQTLPETLSLLRKALKEMLVDEDPELKKARERLLWSGIEWIEVKEYEKIYGLEVDAQQRGYSILQ